MPSRSVCAWVLVSLGAGCVPSSEEIWPPQRIYPPLGRIVHPIATDIITYVLKPIRTNCFICAFRDIQPTLGRQKAEEMCSK